MPGVSWTGDSEEEEMGRRGCELSGERCVHPKHVNSTDPTLGVSALRFG